MEKDQDILVRPTHQEENSPKKRDAAQIIPLNNFPVCIQNPATVIFMCHELINNARSASPL